MATEVGHGAPGMDAAGRLPGVGMHVVLVQPRIAGNSGNVIRLAAATGACLHLVEPLGFDLADAKLRRSGLDYHDLAVVTVHPGLDHLWEAVLPAAVYAFATSGTTAYSDIEYRPGDVLMFGPEPTGLDPAILTDHRVTERVRIPMLPARRSLNLANSVALVVYEAWRQVGFADSV
jgi:tRNA (cytidine/uridine-2'-O-)-methyltransferase